MISIQFRLSNPFAHRSTASLVGATLAATPHADGCADGVQLSATPQTMSATAPRGVLGRTLFRGAAVLGAVMLASSLSGCAAVALGGAAYAIGESHQAERTAQQAVIQTGASPAPAPAAHGSVLNNVGAGTHKMVDGFQTMGRGIADTVSDGWHQFTDGWKKSN